MVASSFAERAGAITLDAITPHRVANPTLETFRQRCCIAFVNL